MGLSEALYLAAATAPPVLEKLEGFNAYCPWIIGLPLIAFMIISFATRSRGPVSAGVCIASLSASCLISLGLAAERAGGDSPVYQVERVWLGVGEPLKGAIMMGVLVDNLSVYTSAMVTFIATLVAIYSYGYMSKEIGHFPTQDSASLSRFFGYLSLFVFSMLGLVFSSNLLQTFIFWELVGVCSYFLIGFWYFKKSAADANKKSFVVTKFADLFFLIGILAVGLGAGTFRFTDLNALESAQFSLLGWAALPLILIFFGPIGKSAQFPLHVWLPDAMEGPTPVSALIHAATMVAAGIYLVARLFGLYHLPEAAAAAYFVALVGSLTALMAALIAVVQNDIKKVLAYSTISQLGFMLTGLGAGGYTAGLFHLFTHAFFKALLFLGSGAVIVACHSNDIWRMGGLKKYLPKTHFAFAAGCLALAGVPPLAGFWSKDEILAAVAHWKFPFVLLVVAAFLTAFYVTRMYCIAFLGEYRGDDEPSRFAGMVPGDDLPAPVSPSKWSMEIEPEWSEEQAVPGEHPPACLGAKQEHAPHHDGPPHEVPATMYGPLLILALFAIGLGAIGLPGEHNVFAGLIHHSAEGEHHFSLAVMAGSVVIALAGIAFGYSLFGKEPENGEERLRSMLGRGHTWLAQKLYLDHFWAKAVSVTMFTASKVSAWLDDEIVDGLVRGTSTVTGGLAEKMRKEHSGQVSHYLFMLIAALMLLTALLAAVNPDFALSPSQLFRPDLPMSPMEGGFGP